jgi:formate dehydrogenase gamma subunit
MNGRERCRQPRRISRPFFFTLRRPRSGTLLLASIFLVSAVLPARAIDDADCMICHADPSASKTGPDGHVISLYVDETTFRKSKHGEMSCDMCHSDISELPHAADLEPVNCGICHVEADEYAASLHGQALMDGTGDIHGCQDCHGAHDIRGHEDPLSMTHKRNLPQTCGQCHNDPGLVERHMVSIREPSKNYLKSVHAQNILEGNLDAAVCNDCHGTHTIKPAHDPESMVNRWNVAETCGNCHAEERDVFMNSIHGLALKAGIRDAPTCTDCHGEHDIEGPSGADSRVTRQMVSRETCPKCHDDEQVMTRYGIETMRQASYMDSYHGMASAAGSQIVASCTSCHGVHNILPESDPASTINDANLVETCAKCHEEAGPNFAAGPVHLIPTSPDQKALGIVRMAYLWLLAVLIGGMVLHNMLIMMRHMLVKLFAESHKKKTHKRFNLGQTIGHFILTVSFTALAISGFALRYPETWWSHKLFFGDLGLEIRADIHRWAAVVFIGITLVNLIYILFTKGGRKEMYALAINRHDIKHVFQNLAYAVGLRKERPLFDRYSYTEKFEYWGLWWGTILMIVTGLCMWYANTFLQYFPKIWLDVAALIHYYEAWLAVATIVVWHLFYMILDPEAYPMNWSWVTGRITEEDFKERHPLEYERYMRAKEKEDSEEA